MAIGDERVGTLGLSVCMLDRIGQQSALGLQGWPAMLRQVSYQRVEECPEAPRHLVLPGPEGPDLIQGELDEILPRRCRVHEPYHPHAVRYDPDREVLGSRVPKKILDPVERLHRSGRVVDGRGKRP